MDPKKIIKRQRFFLPIFISLFSLMACSTQSPLDSMNGQWVLDYDKTISEGNVLSQAQLSKTQPGFLDKYKEVLHKMSAVIEPETRLFIFLNSGVDAKTKYDIVDIDSGTFLLRSDKKMMIMNVVGGNSFFFHEQGNDTVRFYFKRKENVLKSATDEEKIHIHQFIVSKRLPCTRVDEAKMIHTYDYGGYFLEIYKAECDGGKFIYRLAGFDGDNAPSRTCAEHWTANPSLCTQQKMGQ